MTTRVACVVFAFALTLCACSNETDSRQALQKSGYVDIQITGWEPFSCGEDDTWSTGFRAKNPTGQQVNGVVCCGLLIKSCTVRF